MTQQEIPHPPATPNICEVCEEQAGIWICPQCDGVLYCDSCWGTQQAHKKPKRAQAPKPGQSSHEKTDSEVYHRLQGVFRQDRTEEEQHDLHASDIDTTWFGVVRDEANGRSSRPWLRHGNRLVEIMRESHTGEYTERFPHLVSFVGHTGAGKSTVIKLLISRAEKDIRSQRLEKFPVPVTGLSNDIVATTGDVHLYSDPATFLKQTPLLYADCEGLSGGENLPLGAIAKEKVDNSKASSSRNTRSHVSRVLVKGKTKVLAWADSAKTQSRQHSVQELYPRILYTFSDVIVFVLREARMFQSEVLPHLAQWAQSSIDKSVNQPALPHIIIVLNATDNTVDSSHWDSGFATEKLLDDYKDSVFQVADLHQIVTGLRENGIPIRTTKELLDFYYASITVVRIPVKGNYLQIEEQVGKLYNAIQQKCDVNHQRKKSARMLLNAERLQQYVTSAFDHFSRRLDQPFNFVKEALRYTPIPKDFGGHILNLILALYDTNNGHDHDPCDLLKRLSQPIAYCLMLAAAREDMQGQYTTLLQYVFSKPIEEAYEEFRSMWVPCAFRKDGIACCNVMNSHDKGHQGRSGKILSKDPYITPRSLEKFTFKDWQELIEKNLQKLSAHAHRFGSNGVDDGGMTEKVTVSKLHQRACPYFYSQFVTSAFTPDLLSTATCFTCIRNIPEHVLPCGHAICGPCVRLFGEPVEGSKESSGTFVLRSCPLLHTHTSHSWGGRQVRIRFKPKDAGVRVLCLDGGGVRGIVELIILKGIEEELGQFVKVQDFFDLIVGTSTGGIIALGLGVKNWRVSFCIRKFKQLSAQAFTERQSSVLKYAAMVHHKSLYKTKPLEEALKEAFDADTALFGGQFQSSGEISDIKVAVTSTTAAENHPVIMTNYNIARVEKDDCSYQRSRAQSSGAELKVWEAARATSAAPLYFKPYVKPETGTAYTDGAIHNNCPVLVADHERGLIWNDVRDWSPDILLSLGTGCGPVSEEEVRKNIREAEKMHDGKATKTSGFRYMLRLAFHIIDNQINCEKKWEEYCRRSQTPGSEHMRVLEQETQRRQLRINVDFPTERPALDAIRKLHEIENQAVKAVEYNPDIREIAHRLVASSFYFEQKRGNPRRQEGVGYGYTVEGTIRCRFEEGSPKSKAFGKTLKEFLSRDFEPYFLIQENYGTDEEVHHERYFMERFIIQRMCDTGVFDLEQTINIHTAAKSNLTRISLCLQDKAHYINFPKDSHLSISGFPRVLVEDQLMKPLPVPPIEDAAEEGIAGSGLPFEQALPRESTDSVSGRSGGSMGKDPKPARFGGRLFGKTGSQSVVDLPQRHTFPHR
ncbi:hypothetical protein V8F20_006268 [Naviculisporaceae sp. PSN 640]